MKNSTLLAIFALLIARLCSAAADAPKSNPKVLQPSWGDTSAHYQIPEWQ